MEPIDLVLIPILLIAIGIGGAIISRFLEIDFRSYFLIGLGTKVIGAISLGLIYHYYYGYGDTIAFFDLAKFINSFFLKDFDTWFNMMTSNDISGENHYFFSRFKYGYHELFFVRFIAFFSLFTANSYYGTALIFALISFIGSWCIFIFLTRRYPKIHKQLFLSVFLIPSIIFWGSGLLKDTLIFASIGFCIYSVLLISKGKIARAALLIGIGLWILISIRPFMLTILAVPFGVWLFTKYTVGIKHIVLKIIASIFALGVGLTLIYFSFERIVYQLVSFSEQAEISANYLYRISRKTGSAYYLGHLDGTLQSIISLAPDAIWVSLFRPYFWESNNVVMLLTATESFLFLFAFILLLFKSYFFGFFQAILNDGYLQFVLVFCLLFAFIIGISTFNFGSLARYRMPILPFFVSALFIIWHKYKQSRLPRGKTQ